MPRTKIDRRIVKTKRAISLALFQILAEKNVDDITITELTTSVETLTTEKTALEATVTELTTTMETLTTEKEALQLQLDELATTPAVVEEVPVEETPTEETTVGV